MLNLPINILKSDITKILDKLTENTPAVWGKMSGQHMLEHLTMGLKISNGSLPLKRADAFDALSEKEQKMRINDLEGSCLFKPGTKSPVAGENPEKLRKKSMDDAKIYFLKDLEKYRVFWNNNPDSTFLQPAFGKLNMDQWHTFHNKHIYHHFLQFNMVRNVSDKKL